MLVEVPRNKHIYLINLHHSKVHKNTCAQYNKFTSKTCLDKFTSLIHLSVPRLKTNLKMH